ncbi:MAG: Spy/CpxP family protein refolding chaperone [Candidatus Omnitrophota bacterium]
MDKKLIGIVLVVFVLIFSAFTVGAYSGNCPESGGKTSGKTGEKTGEKAQGYQGGLEEKFAHKAHFILENKEGLGLSEEQVKKIKDLKLETQKGLILKDAEIDIVALDIKDGLYQDTVNASAVNKLIDKKYELKKQKAQSLVSAYAALKNILTDEQKEKMSELFEKSAFEMMHESIMQGEMGQMMYKHTDK